MIFLDYLKKAKTVKLSKHFTLFDICNSKTAIAKNIDNTPTPQAITNAGLLIKNILEPVTIHFKTLPNIHCFIRNKILNKAVGGVDTSQHISGQAVDFSIVGVSLEKIVDYIRHNLEFDQLILENGWVHVSFSNVKNRKQVLKLVNGKYEAF